MNNISYEVVAAVYPGDDGGFQPGYQILVNGNFLSGYRFEMTFDEEKYAWPYARMFAEEQMDLIKMLLGNK